MFYDFIIIIGCCVVFRIQFETTLSYPSIHFNSIRIQKNEYENDAWLAVGVDRSVVEK